MAKIVSAITTNISRYHEEFPVMQINQTSLVAVIDEYIRNKLFNEPFNPMEGNNWRVLMLLRGEVIKHIMKEVSQSIYELQNSVDVEEAIIDKRKFSDVPQLKMRENFSLNIKKSIYERTPYPSNKGKFEKDFLEFMDADSKVERLLKINENYHKFARMKYIRTDGMLSSYSPDFIVKIDSDIYIVETKAKKDVSQENVIQKQKGAIDWIKKVNQLRAEDRMDAIWHYVILDDKTFKAMKDQGALTKDMLEYGELTNAQIKGTLF